MRLETPLGEIEMTRKRQTPHKKHVFIHRASSIGTVLPPPKREEKNQEDGNFRFFFVQSVPNETGGNGVRFWVPTVVPPVGCACIVLLGDPREGFLASQVL